MTLPGELEARPDVPGPLLPGGQPSLRRGGDCSRCGGKRRREPGLSYSWKKLLLSIQRPPGL